MRQTDILVRARLFKMNDNISKRDLKIPKVLYAKTPPFLTEKNVRSFCSAKASLFFFQEMHWHT